MKSSFASSLILCMSSLAVTNAFLPALHQQIQGSKSSSWQLKSSQQARVAGFTLRMSDFPSAMPEKPKQTLEEKIGESADGTIALVEGTLGEGVEAPPELAALKKAREDGAGPNELSVLIYDLMIERGMRYDEEPETGTLTPTEFNIKENLDVPEVKEEFKYLYTYGMKLISSGLLTREQVEKSVKERLVARTGLTPEEFDKWLGF